MHNILHNLFNLYKNSIKYKCLHFIQKVEIKFIICPKCHSEVWQSWDSNSGSPDSNTERLRHPGQPRYLESRVDVPMTPENQLLPPPSNQTRQVEVTREVYCYHLGSRELNHRVTEKSQHCIFNTVLSNYPLEKAKSYCRQKRRVQKTISTSGMPLFF